MMKTMDVDQDGQIDYMEFVAASMSAYQMSHGLMPGSNASWLNRVRVVFDKIDEDGNGFITPGELSKLLGNSEGVQEIIREADKNGDGLIDYEECVP
jgi:Ca2+-binding EF-hand superfamily protein